MAYSTFYRVDNLCMTVSPAVQMEMLTFPRGSGQDWEVNVGHPRGTRRYRVKSDSLPNTTAQSAAFSINGSGQVVFDTPFGQMSRARYLWELFILTKANQSIGIVLNCPIEKEDVSVKFADNSLSYESVAYQLLWGVGVEFAQVRRGGITNGMLTVDNPMQI